MYDYSANLAYSQLVGFAALCRINGGINPNLITDQTLYSMGIHSFAVQTAAHIAAGWQTVCTFATVQSARRYAAKLATQSAGFVRVVSQ